MLRPATKEPSLCGWYNYFKGISVGFIPMSTTVLRHDAEKAFFRVSIAGTQGFIQLFEWQTFRKPILLAAVIQALRTHAPRALVVHGGNCFTPGPSTALRVLLHVRKTDSLGYGEKSRQLVPSLVFPGRDLKLSWINFIITHTHWTRMAQINKKAFLFLLFHFDGLTYLMLPISHVSCWRLSHATLLAH